MIRSESESDFFLMAKYIYTYSKLTWCGWCIGHNQQNSKNKTKRQMFYKIEY